MRLTKRQRQELEALAEKPRTTNNRRYDGAPPHTHLKNCARVQNSLQALGLAEFVDDEQGTRRELSVVEVVTSYGNPRPLCRITDKGRAALAELTRGA